MDDTPGHGIPVVADAEASTTLITLVPLKLG
jgi:hypothetical protein